MRRFRKAQSLPQDTVKIRAVVEAEVPREIAERLVAQEADFTQSVFMADWTYRVGGVLRWERA